jgi:hypothetical protein
MQSHKAIEILEEVRMSDISYKISKQVIHRGVTIPTFLYGTAWKEDQTEALTLLAIES